MGPVDKSSVIFDTKWIMEKRKRARVLAEVVWP